MNKEDKIGSLNILFKRLRGSLFSLAESALPPEQAKAANQMIRRLTSTTWTEITKLIEESEE